jgi:hypothetical protein
LLLPVPFCRKNEKDYGHQSHQQSHDRKGSHFHVSETDNQEKKVFELQEKEVSFLHFEI